MRLSVENWAYVYIKLARFRKKVFTPGDVQKYAAITTLEQFIQIVPQYFPGITLSPSTLTLMDFERTLWKEYFKVLTRILNTVPQRWQFWIIEYILKFQIKNLKVILLGKIAELDTELIRSFINWDVEEILGTKKITENILSQKSVREILYSLQDSRYGSVLREGLAHYFNEKDSFYFQIYLDRYYYRNALVQTFNLSSAETELVQHYFNIEAEYHNVRTIYRSLNSGFEPRIIVELLVPSNFILSPKNFAQLYSMKTPHDMAKMYVEIISKQKKYKFFSEQPVINNIAYYTREFYSRLQLEPVTKTAEMEIRTLDEIFHIFKWKEYAIYHFSRILTQLQHHVQFTDEEIND